MFLLLDAHEFDRVIQHIRTQLIADILKHFLYDQNRKVSTIFSTIFLTKVSVLARFIQNIFLIPKKKTLSDLIFEWGYNSGPLYDEPSPADN